jgi:hypothetical protein
MAVLSIQADPAAKRRIAKSRRAGRSQVQALNDECLRHASNHQAPWENDDVDTLVNMISGDHTTYDMARTLRRSYYATQMARQHVGFCLRHAESFRKALGL